MTITWNELTVSMDHLDRQSLVEDWQWLIGSALPILITSLGDAFVQTESGEIYWLVTGSAEYEKVADTYEDFQHKLKSDELVNEWFLVPVVQQLLDRGMLLETGKLYGFIKIPVFGGKYEPSNFELTDIEVHFALTGQMNQHIKDIPDGAKVKLVVEE